MERYSQIKIMSFLDCHNFAIQVSFDGDEHYHNLERCNRLGKGTYHRIINNLSVMLEKYKNLSIQARVNISKRNYISIQKLFLDLKSIQNLKILIFILIL